MTRVERVLVTGGAGFIGSHLVQRLLRDGAEVAVIDDFSRGLRPNLPEPDPRLTIHEHDIADVEFLNQTLRRSNITKVFHLAAVHYIPYCIAHPAETLRVNVVGTQAVLEAIATSAVRAFVFSSTSDVYAPKGEPFVENDTLEPLDIHGLSKLFCERLIAHASKRRHETSFLVARLFNPYGPNETNPHVIPHLMSELERGDVVRLGNVHPQRDFIHIDDVVDALVRLSNLTVPFEVFNVGTNVSCSVGELVELFASLTGRQVRIVTDEKRVRSIDHDVLIANNQKVRVATGWKPAVQLRAGLSRLLHSQGFLQAGS